MPASRGGFLRPVNPKKVPLEERMSTWRRQRDTTGVDWRDVSATSLRGALHVALADGDAVMFSSASGGRGVCITLFDDGGKLKEYASTAEELSTLLNGIIEALGSESEDVRQALAGGAD